MDKEKETVITVRNLKKTYYIGENGIHALNGVDFEIYKGEFCAIVGTSGSGKSTLLNMMAGLEKPTKGEIIIAGEHLENMSESGLVNFRRDHVGFIFQSYNLMPSLNAIENVALPLTFRGMQKDKRERLAIKALKQVGLSKYLKHRPTQMSGGQQQRVGIARALVLRPEIIFADEPTGNLDSNTSEEVMSLMQRVVTDNNQTLVMVTHDDHLATYADRIFRILDGKIINIEENEKSRENREDMEENGSDTAE
ncbi:MAG: ABC transporter ATP-binding protein [Lachnospiraceae bacterium]|nr:ABC transporter ATP-binding protein [Lachnospiraceae bacterium]